MGFNIGSLLGAVSPILGSLLGGSIGGTGGSQVGALLGQAVGASFARPPPSAISAVVPSPVSANGFAPAMARRMPLRLPSPSGAASGPSRRMLILRAAAEVVGHSVSTRDMVSAARHCGLEQAAAMFGLSVEDVCFIIMLGTRRKRARGISAADLRRTRSTIRKVKNIAADLGIGRSGGTNRRRSPTTRITQVK